MASRSDSSESNKGPIRSLGTPKRDSGKEFGSRFWAVCIPAVAMFATAEIRAASPPCESTIVVIHEFSGSGGNRTLVMIPGTTSEKCLETKVNIKEDFIFYPGSQEIALAEKGMFNFDHPDAFDWDLLESVLLVAVSQLNELKVIRYHR